MFTLRDTEPAGERYGEGASGEARGRSGKKREGDDLGSGGWGVKNGNPGEAA